jgi:hypothetical protein
MCVLCSFLLIPSNTILVEEEAVAMLSQKFPIFSYPSLTTLLNAIPLSASNTRIA